MRCPVCGSNNNEQARFCTACGTALTQNAPSQAAPGAQNIGQQPPQYQPYPGQPPQYPPPPRKKGKGCLIAAIITVIVLLIVGVIAVVAFTMFTTHEFTSDPQIIEQIPSPDSSLESGEESSEIIAIRNPGDTIALHNVSVTLEAARKYDGNDFIKPEEGNVFVNVILLIENTSAEDVVISSVLMFNAYADDLSIHESIMAHTEEFKTLDGSIASGKKLSGSLIYEVPSDWKELEIHANLSAVRTDDSNRITIIIKSDSVK